MSDLIAALKAERETKLERVRECQAALDAAKADADAFTRHIAEELGLTSSAASGDRMKVIEAAKVRRERVAELHSAGKTIIEIAAELKIDRGFVDHDLVTLRKLGKLEPQTAVQEEGRSPVIGSKQQRVLELLRQGESRQAIADALHISLASVYTHLSALRKTGDIAAVETSSELPDDDVEEPEESVPVVDDGSQDSNERGASKEDLQTEVARQQGGIRGKAVILGCTMTKHHRHAIRVDRMGDGHTTSKPEKA